MKDYITIPVNNTDNMEYLFACLVRDGVSVHPDTDFNDVVTADNSPMFAEKEAEALNERMTECFALDLSAYEFSDVYETCLYVWRTLYGQEVRVKIAPEQGEGACLSLPAGFAFGTRWLEPDWGTVTSHVRKITGEETAGLGDSCGAAYYFFNDYPEQVAIVEFTVL